MNNILIIKDIPSIKIGKKEYTYISSNKYYSGIHWSIRNKIKDLWHYLVKECIDNSKLIKYKNKVSIDFYWNTRYDLDNNAIMRKMIIDSLVINSIIKDDTKKYIVKISDNIFEENYIKVVINEEK